MGLRPPFGYVGYEHKMAMAFVNVLDNFCSYCHTNKDYENGCRGCPAGRFVFACREYILSLQEEDRYHAECASDTALDKSRQRGLSEEAIQSMKAMELEVAASYAPECDVLRQMKQCIKGIIPHPLFYVRHNKRPPHERPKRLEKFLKLALDYDRLQAERRARMS